MRAPVSMAPGCGCRPGGCLSGTGNPLCRRLLGRPHCKRGFPWRFRMANPGARLDPSGLADFTDIVLRPMDDKVGSGLKVAIDRVGADSVKAFVRDAVAIAYDPAERNKWSNGGEAARWQSAIQAAQTSMANGYKSRLTEALTRMMCKPRWSTGNLAAGIARRSQAQQFRGDPIAIYDRLRSDRLPRGEGDAATTLEGFRHIRGTVTCGLGTPCSIPVAFPTGACARNHVALHWNLTRTRGEAVAWW